jgi:hypothetical protein
MRRAPWPIPTGAPDVTRFLEGPQPRGFELRRAARIFLEFLRGFRALHFVGPCVTVFGSSRFDETHPYYAMARELGGGLARAGFTVMTAIRSTTPSSAGAAAARRPPTGPRVLRNGRTLLARPSGPGAAVPVRAFSE